MPTSSLVLIGNDHVWIADSKGKRRISNEINPNHSPLPPSDLEPSAKDALPGKAQAVQMDQRVCVRVHSKGRRLADIDGYVIKPIFDAFTKAGIWTDDSGRYVKEVSFSQEVSEVEETVIDIVWE